MLVLGIVLLVVGLSILVKSEALGRGLEGVQTEGVRNYELRQKRLKTQSVWKRILSLFFYPVWPVTVGARDNRAIVAGAGVLIMIMGLTEILGGLGLV